jgi:hypothetical protein
MIKYPFTDFGIASSVKGYKKRQGLGYLLAMTVSDDSPGLATRHCEGRLKNPRFEKNSIAPRQSHD